MNTVDRTLALKLVADVGTVGKDMRKVEDGTKKVDGRFKSMAKSTAAWGKALGGALVLGGLERLVSASIDGVKAFRQEQTQVRNFTRTVKNMGLPVGRATRALDRMADRAVNMGFDDGDMIAGMDAFLKKTGSIEKAVTMNNLAMDIARARNIDLAAAQKVVAGIYDGSGKALKAYNLEGVHGMEAVTRARRIERGRAAEWARNHPMEVLLGKISDGFADVVGNLSQGNFGAAIQAGQKLVDNIVKGVMGYTNSKGKHVRGLLERLFDASEDSKGRPRGIINKLGQGIADEFAKVDWAKTLSDALGTAFETLKGLVESGGLTQIVAFGGAIAAAVFAVNLFIDAAKTLFNPGNWHIGTIAGRAARGAGAVLGIAMRAGMFVTSMFVDRMSALMGRIGGAKGLASAATALGKGVGWKIGAGIVAGITLYGPIQDYIQSVLPNHPAGGVGDPLPRKPGGDSGVFRFPWEEGGLFNPRKGNAAGIGNAGSGWQWVGENGPELMRFRGGERVKNHGASMAMAGGGNTYIINLPPTSDPNRWAQMVMDGIKQHERNNGKGWRS